ncbi:photosynthetic reaction center cytochrome PufC [uncultured Salinisphaera sp.]|uniref:photosynthetic reaction center cytochrome PufC n=1 Tax=uncultured Salinisphaera sp. TaxID=359372 RepID=UPI0032B1B6A3|tara:strand:+ start:776 stop:2011 length:1236 start_codon:yes stop_codon:yes gene_type:complete
MIRRLFNLARSVVTQMVSMLRMIGMLRLAVLGGGIVVVLLTCFMLFTAGWDRPPIKSVQTGYRGGGQSLVYNPREVDKNLSNTQFQNAPPAADTGGPKASEVWENVQVLGNLSVGQFIRQMQGMSNAIAPDQGCSYCHANGNYASDELYTKKVARRMLQMTRQINTKWDSHVDGVGVTCWTCHRGKHVPDAVWADKVAGVTNEGSTAEFMPNSYNGYSSLPSDVYNSFYEESWPINVQGHYAMPNGNDKNVKDTERVFGVMIHMSNALGVNCSYCHNSRAFSSWDGQSRPNKIRAWYGIHMLRELNTTYMNSLADVFPANRKGPDGKPFGINCQTCHQGVYKPLYGQKVIADYPELAVPNNSGGNGQAVPAGAPLPGDAQDKVRQIPGVKGEWLYGDDPRASTERKQPSPG